MCISDNTTAKNSTANYTTSDYSSSDSTTSDYSSSDSATANNTTANNSAAHYTTIDSSFADKSAMILSPGGAMMTISSDDLTAMSSSDYSFSATNYAPSSAISIMLGVDGNDPEKKNGDSFNHHGNLEI